MPQITHKAVHPLIHATQCAVETVRRRAPYEGRQNVMACTKSTLHWEVPWPALFTGVDAEQALGLRDWSQENPNYVLVPWPTCTACCVLLDEALEHPHTEQT